ncbi:MAG: hypothetical protein CMG75_05440 [Candidatus Marinimicrobia bacterium]|nr:hypothetical protein [Candidatus Neomarinimicrobiota bacterium]|tara:strand:+ start:2069 stop:3160 length:1092 start_codon:yes stop_codon:yes gene_type:complete
MQIRKIIKYRFSIIITLLIFGCIIPNNNNSLVKAYITLQGVDKVAVIDVRARKVIKTIDVDFIDTGDRPHYVVIDKSNGYWYVTLISSGYILKFDLERDEFIDSVRIGNMPALMALDEPNQILYISRFMPMPSMGMVGSNASIIDIIDASNMKAIGKIDVGASSPHGIALSSDGKKLWVASNEASHFFEIEISRLREEGYQPRNFKIGLDVPDSYNINDMIYNALELELNKKDSKLFITCSGSNEVRIFDTSSGEIITKFFLKKQPWHIALSNDNKSLFTTNRGGQSVSKINLETESIEEVSDSLLQMPHGCALIPDESELIVSAAGGNRVLVVDTKSMKILDIINFDTQMSMPTGIAIYEKN